MSLDGENCLNATFNIGSFDKGHLSDLKIKIYSRIVAYGTMAYAAGMRMTRTARVNCLDPMVSYSVPVCFFKNY